MDFYKTEIGEMTLKQALNAYYLKNPSFTPYYQLKSDRAKMLVKAHDVSHLVFGCDTDLLGEMVVQLWAKYAIETKLSWPEKIKYFAQFEALKLVLNPSAIAFFITRREEFKKLNSEILARSKVMQRKWRYFEEETFLNQTIFEIREGLGLRIL